MEIEQLYYDYSYLPSHVLVDIISYLNLADFKNAVLTCKSWYCASCNRKITKKILINGLTDSSSIDYLQRPIYNIRLSAVNLNKFNFRKLLRKFGHSIHDLDLLFPKLSITRLFEIFIYLPNVETVKIHIVSHFYSVKNFNMFKRLVTHRETIYQNLKQIKFLTVHTRLHELKPMQQFLSQCVNVEKLNWNEWIYMPFDQTIFLCEFLLEPRENPMITSLNDLLIGCIDPINSSHILEKLISISLPNLKRLHLKEIAHHTYDIVFREFCKTYHYLDEFTLNGCNDQQIVDICRNMTNLRSLALYNCIATDFKPIANLARLESLNIKRVATFRDDLIIELLSLKLKGLTKLSLNMTTKDTLKFICDHYPGLEELVIDGLDTKDCEPIFRSLTKLKVLSLAFIEHATCHSSRLKSSDEYNITCLTQLQELTVSCWVPGITPTFIPKLKNLKHIYQDICLVYDPTEEEFAVWRLAAQARIIQDINDLQIVTSDDELDEYELSDFNLDMYTE